MQIQPVHLLALSLRDQAIFQDFFDIKPETSDQRGWTGIFPLKNDKELTTRQGGLFESDVFIHAAHALS